MTSPRPIESLLQQREVKLFTDDELMEFRNHCHREGEGIPFALDALLGQAKEANRIEQRTAEAIATWLELRLTESGARGDTAKETSRC